MMGNGKPEVKTDCFGYKNKNGRQDCTALRKLYCKTEKCPFYKKKRK